MASGVWRRLAMEQCDTILCEQCDTISPEPELKEDEPKPNPEPNPHQESGDASLWNTMRLAPRAVSLRELSQVTLTLALTSSLTLTLAHCDGW